MDFWRGILSPLETRDYPRHIRWVEPKSEPWIGLSWIVPMNEQ